jgi:hypothetical protein
MTPPSTIMCIDLGRAPRVGRRCCASQRAITHRQCRRAIPRRLNGDGGRTPRVNDRRRDEQGQRQQHPPRSARAISSSSKSSSSAPFQLHFPLPSASVASPSTRLPPGFALPTRKGTPPFSSPHLIPQLSVIAQGGLSADWGGGPLFKAQNTIFDK